jgi:hypothetical protein
MRSRGAGGRARSGKEAAAGPRPPPPVVYGRCGVAQRRPGTHAAGSGASSWREAGMSGGDGRCAGSVAAWKAGGTGWWYWCLSRTIRGGTGSSPRRLSSSAKAVHETPSAMGAARTMARGRRANLRPPPAPYHPSTYPLPPLPATPVRLAPTLNRLSSVPSAFLQAPPPPSPPPFAPAAPPPPRGRPRSTSSTSPASHSTGASRLRSCSWAYTRTRCSPPARVPATYPSSL